MLLPSLWRAMLSALAARLMSGFQVAHRLLGDGMIELWGCRLCFLLTCVFFFVLSVLTHPNVFMRGGLEKATE